MPSVTNTGPVLIISAQADALAARVRERFPQLSVHTASRADTIPAAFTQHRPQVVMSCRSPALPGALHRAAVTDPGVRWVQVAGAGFDHLQPITRDDLVVTNCAGVLSEFMAETVLGAMLMLNYGLTGYVAQQRERCWQGHAWCGLRGRTALILGLGNIGRAVAAHCQYLGMHVLGLRRSAAEVAGVDELVAAEALHAALARCDVLCLHVPLTQHTRGLIDRAEFAALKPGALVVNTARGGVMVEGALHDALRDGRVRGAFVDVFEQEPLPPDSPLWDAPNLFISPHMADTVSDYEQRFTDFFADNLQRWLDGEALHNVVDPIAGY